jgi:tripartite-type tricarboxylate transporter receptor subunit TctC
VPEPILERLNAEIVKMTSNPETGRAWAAQGANAMQMTRKAFERYLEEDIEKWARIVRISGAKAGE